MAQTAGNPYGLCNFDPEADCAACPVHTRLFCHFALRDVGRFVGLFLPPLLALLSGLALRGQWAAIGVWFVALFLFLQVPENTILCRHCPYYAQGGRRTLLCHANAGLLKLWKFTPRPMARWEKAAFLGALGAFAAAPIGYSLWAGEILAGVAGMVGAGGWVWAMQRYVCRRCPNFSCPLNTVPEDIRAAYLRRNPVLAETWGQDPDG